MSEFKNRVRDAVKKVLEDKNVRKGFALVLSALVNLTIHAIRKK